MERHPTQTELLTSAIRTVEEILAPELRSAWARASAGQLVGLLRYTLATQGSTSLERQDLELRAAMSGLFAHDPSLASVAQTDAATAGPPELREAAGRLLVHAQGAADGATRIRELLRPLLARHLDEDLAESGPLLQGFMSRGRGGDVE